MNKLFIAIMPYVPKRWKFIVFLIMIAPLLISSVNSHIDDRIDSKMSCLAKTQDSIYLVLQYNKESYVNLNKNIDRLNDNVDQLKNLLISRRRN